ncbi:hypothetical protein TcCL_ESM08559 [Trypanosoma cruzi]|nr:hypothetical protein TcCL_ESM08559 [Trypanosoma cruzi]
MYRCRPAVPLAELMVCLPVLLFFSALPAQTHAHTQVFAQFSAEMPWRQRGVGLRPVLKSRRGRTTPATRKVLPALGVIFITFFFFALPVVGVAWCVLAHDERCHDGLLWR